ncbi:MAG TPA: peptidase U32, partial [Ruminococcaceae bacterium]|nr:peptidase U32 [Oscillospiraceae bacterium]
MEILSPAGSPDSLLAAVRAGADAVYLGASAFSARAAAKNFDDDALRQAAEFCHARGVKVYLAVNTLILQDELPQALALIQYACSLPVDALIVQDMGLVRLLRRCAPSLRLNASTQMSVTSPAGVRALAALGVSRVVLARELSLREIAEIRRGAGNRPIELEVFVHGALCMSVSGQCYFSSVLGSRSGNRGMCAQPCRLPFSVPGGTGHDLSLKDLSMIARIGELKSAGADSAKIEGRMKRPEYVAAATAACRLSADGEAVPPELTHNLSAVFSRSGFTTGYPDGRLGRDMFGIRSKEDVAGATKAVFSGLHELYREERPAVPVRFSLRVCAGEPVTLTARDEEGNLARASLLSSPEPAVHRAVDEARCAEQLRKTGGTPFFARDIRCEIGEGLALPVSRLNRLRRDVLEQLETLRSHREPVPFSSPAPGELFPGPHHAGPMKLRARFQTAG